MIAQAMTPLHRRGWRAVLADVVTDPKELYALLDLPAPRRFITDDSQTPFRLRVPRGYIARMQVGDPTDPLLRQVLPIPAEATQVSGYSFDPLREMNTQTNPGLLSKYRGRVLLVMTGACAIHCRYCFRRHFPYGESSIGQRHLTEVIAALEADKSITEVILSGGDPLTLDDSYLGEFVQRLEEIPHLARLRIHTRLPIVIPERVDDKLLSWLSATRLNTVVVLHVNHANELTDDVAHALSTLRQSGTTLLNQSVLLKGVNDNAAVLKDLSNRLFDANVLPYYLHMLDTVQGAAHFEVGEALARRLIEQIRAELPGYLVPRLAREIAMQPFKTVLA